MDFVELPEHLNCSFVGANSPIILRAEAGTETGGMTVEEFRDMPPMVKLYGSVADAKVQFLAMLDGLAQFIAMLEYSFQRRSTIRADRCWAADRWFQVEVRQPNLRATLYGEGDLYHFSYMLPDGAPTDPIVDALEDAYHRLKAVYERFYDTEI